MIVVFVVCWIHHYVVVHSFMILQQQQQQSYHPQIMNPIVIQHHSYHHHHRQRLPGMMMKTNNNETEHKWVYPSEQQLYNAMRKKGWSNVPEESIPTLLQIHNHINEHTWRQIRAWEGLSNDNNNNNNDLILTRFQGRPRDLTPKAFFWSRILGRNAPFDRHDWYVQRPSLPENANKTLEQRYVIDYYYLPAAQPNLPPIPYIDARPAMTDHPMRALYLHARWWGQWAFPGIATYLQQQQQPNRPSSSLHPSNTNQSNTEPVPGSPNHT